VSWRQWLGGPSCAEVADLVPAVALDAAEPSDRDKVDRHVRVCAACARQLDELRSTAALLGQAVPQAEPPPQLRERVLAVAAQTADGPRPPGRQPLWRRPVVGAWTAVAASVVISLGSLAWIATLEHRVAVLDGEVSAARDRVARYDRMMQVLGSHRLAVRQLTPVVQTMQASGMVYLDPASGSGMVTIHDLPQPPAGRAWQLWYLRGSDRFSGGMLWPDTGGNCAALVAVPPDVDSFEMIGVTEEPSDGSAWPTSPRVIMARLS
jgi:anti-sigma-K factor RskA/putative zinc finger protein